MKFIALATLLGSLAAPALSAPAAATVKDGVEAWQAGNHARAISIWRGPAEAGDADAQYNLAQAYKLGRGVPADLKLAQTWYEKAAAQGHEQAQANLGLILFQNGDRTGAMPWIRKAADRGEPRAQYVLGTAHFNGDFAPRDWPRAYALMTRAAASGLPQAATTLAQMDEYIPLAQRQQGIAMAREMEKKPAAPPPAPSTAAATPKPAPAVKPVPLPPSTPAESAGKPAPALAAKPASKPAPRPVAATTATGGWRIQLGAFGSEAAARTAWTGISGKAGGLKELQPYIVKAGAVSRLQAGPLATRVAADQACRSARAAGAACFIVKL